MLEGFEPVTPLRGRPSLSVTNAGLVFSRNVMQRMGRDSYIVFLINRAEKKIAIQKGDERDERAIRAFHGSNPTRINNMDIDKIIADMMQWDTKSSLHYYHIDGEYIPSEKAIIFDLKMAKEKIKRRRNK